LETLVSVGSLFSAFDEELARVDAEKNIYRKVSLGIALCHNVAQDTWLSVSKRKHFIDQLFFHLILQVNHELLTLLEQRETLLAEKATQALTMVHREIEKINGLLADLGQGLHRYKAQTPYKYLFG